MQILVESEEIILKVPNHTHSLLFCVWNLQECVAEDDDANVFDVQPSRIYRESRHIIHFLRVS